MQTSPPLVTDDLMLAPRRSAALRPAVAVGGAVLLGMIEFVALQRSRLRSRPHASRGTRASA